MSDFALNMRQFQNATNAKMSKIFRRTCFDLASGIIQSTPVDTGRARMNWLTDINSFNNDVLESEDKSGNIAIGKVENTTNSLQLGNTFTLSNNLSYIANLEFGLYPNPVKLGTRVQGGGVIKYEVRSIYGFSTQAPQGMVRINLLRFNTILSNNVRGT